MMQRWARKRSSPVVQVPQNLLASPGILMEDFESVGDWTLVSGTSIANDAVHHITGSQSIAARANATTTRMDKTISAKFSGSCIRFHYYLMAGNAAPSVTIYLSSVTNWSKYFQYSLPGLPGSSYSGWHVASTVRSDWGSAGGETWDNTMILIRVMLSSSGDDTVSFDSLYDDVCAVPAILFTFDDGYPSQYEEAFPYLAARNMRGTIYAITKDIGSVGMISEAQLIAMDESGWTVGHHTDRHQDLSDIGTYDLAAQTAILNAAKADLDGLGLTRNSSHMAYPFGRYDETVTMAALAAANVATAREVTYVGCVMPQPDYYHLSNVLDIYSTTPFATVKSKLEDVVNQRQILNLLGHNLNPVPATWFRDIVDYVANFALEYNVPVLTVEDLQSLRSGAITVDMPRPNAITTRYPSVAVIVWSPADWWTVDGKTCIIAYQSKGAPSRFMSYTNLANPGTYDASPGVAPYWSDSSGWFFDGFTQYLSTGLTIPGTSQHAYTMIIQYNNIGIGVGDYYVLCGEGLNDGFNIAPNNLGNRCYTNGGQQCQSGIPVDANLCVAGTVGYRDGVSDATGIAAGTTHEVPLYIGATNIANAPAWFTSANVTAFALYDGILDGTEVALVAARMALL